MTSGGEVHWMMLPFQRRCYPDELIEIERTEDGCGEGASRPPASFGRLIGPFRPKGRFSRRPTEATTASLPCASVFP